MAGRTLSSFRRIDLNREKKILHELSEIKKVSMKLVKAVDTLAIVLLLALVGVGFIVMKKTTESNAVTAEIALIQAQNKKRVIQEVGLLTAEIKNLQKDLAQVRTILKKDSIHDNNRK
jgi:TRAP-type mannitol/chloroaromatic compound transport system permease large subunit